MKRAITFFYVESLVNLNHVYGRSIKDKIKKYEMVDIRLDQEAFAHRL